MTLGQLTNILVPVSGCDINNKLFIVSLDQAEEVHEDDEEFDEEEEDDPDYCPESDEGYRTTSSCSPSSGSAESGVTPGAMVTGTLGEPTEDEHGNLMWLVDFRLDNITDIDKEEDNNNNNAAADDDTSQEPAQKKQRIDPQPQQQQEQMISYVETVPDMIQVQEVETVAMLQPPVFIPAPPPSYHLPPPPPPPRRYVSMAKPNYTYTDLITLALRDKTALTVSGIYQWIT